MEVPAPRLDPGALPLITLVLAFAGCQSEEPSAVGNSPVDGPYAPEEARPSAPNGTDPPEPSESRVDAGGLVHAPQATAGGGGFAGMGTGNVSESAPDAGAAGGGAGSGAGGLDAGALPHTGGAAGLPASSGGQAGWVTECGPGQAPPASPEPDLEVPPKPPALWTDRSVHVRVEEVGFFSALLFEQHVAWLSEEQLEILQSLDYEWTGEDSCPSEDSGPTTVTVTDEDGSSRVGVSIDPPQLGWGLVRSGVRAFVSTLGCRPWERYRVPLPGAPDVAPRAAPNDGCYHGFSGAGWFVLEVTAQGDLYVTLAGDCGRDASVSLYDRSSAVAPIGSDAGLAPLAASSNAGVEGVCPELAVTLTEAGSYPVFVDDGSFVESMKVEFMTSLRVSTP